MGLADVDGGAGEAVGGCTRGVRDGDFSLSLSHGWSHSFLLFFYLGEGFGFLSSLFFSVFHGVGSVLASLHSLTLWNRSSLVNVAVFGAVPLWVSRHRRPEPLYRMHSLFSFRSHG